MAPPCAFVSARAMEPASAMMAVSSVAVTSTRPDEVMLPPVTDASVAPFTITTAPEAATATARPARCSWVFVGSGGPPPPAPPAPWPELIATDPDTATG